MMETAFKMLFSISYHTTACSNNIPIPFCLLAAYYKKQLRGKEAFQYYTEVGWEGQRDYRNKLNKKEL